MNKLVTVGIPFFNNESSLELAIKSTIKQTYQRLEIILVNDGSTDGSIEIAKKYAALDSRIRIINDNQNRGLIYRLNQIIDEAQGFYLARMDADDLMDVTRLEKQVKVFENNPLVDVVTTGMVSLDNNLNPLGKRCCTSTNPDVYQVFKNGDGLVHASMMAKTSWWKEHKYLEGFDRAEDRELFTRTIASSSYFNITEPLYFYKDVQNIDLLKYLKSYKSERISLRKNWKNALAKKEYLELLFRSYLKSIVIRGCFALRLQERLFHSKNTCLSDPEKGRVRQQINLLNS